MTNCCDECNAIGDWRILIVDDDKDVHLTTITAMEGEEVLGRQLRFEHAYSATHAFEILQKDRDFAVILLDVVMEHPHAGLDLVARVRDELDMKLCRILLRTGQPGHAPEVEVIRNLDINDYLYKANISAQRLLVSLTSAIKSYDQLRQLEQTSNGIAGILECTNELSELYGAEEFVDTVVRHTERIFPEGVKVAIAYAGKAGRDGGVDLTVIGASQAWSHLMPDHETPSLDAYLERVRQEKMYQLMQTAHQGCKDMHEGCCIVTYVALEPMREVVVCMQFARHPNDTARMLVAQLINSVKICAKRLLAARERMRQSMISMGILAHEFRTPIAAVQMDLQTIEAMVGASAPSNANRLNKVISHAADMVQSMDAHIDRSMKNFGVVFKEGYLLPTSNIEVCSLVRDLIANHQSLFEEIGSPVLDLPEQLYVVGEKESLEQALMNLLSNAIKAVLRREEIVRPAITIKVEQLRTHAAISVIDKGIGMSPREAKMAFEPFVSSSIEPSHGLGLTMVKKAVQAMKGTVTVESEVGAGTTFQIQLWLPT